MIALCIAGSVCAESYRELTASLKSATERSDVHRLKSQIAEAAAKRLETEALSKSDRTKLRLEIQAHCADVQLGSMDIWYGSSVVSWGRVMILDGKWKEARSVLLDQAEVLQNIEKNLKANGIPVSAISPVAGCRYLLGETYRVEYEEFQTLEPAVNALKHFYNVHIKYGDSCWGESAQQRADDARKYLESRGKHVRIELGPHRDTFIANKFKLGSRLLSEKRYADALEPTETALNYFPETTRSVQALRTLAICNQQLEEPEAALMIAEYCAERFHADTNAPGAILSIGRQAIECGHERQGEHLFNLYLSAFPSDSHRADILSYFAWKAFNAENWPEAVARFQSLEVVLRNRGISNAELEKAVFIQATHPADVEKLDAFISEFPDSELVASAFSKKAQAQLVAGDLEAAFQTLEKCTSKTALAGLIVAAVEAGQFELAGQVLNRMLDDKEAYGSDIYLSTADELMAAEQYALAEKAFSAVPASDPRALLGTASAQFGRGQFEACLQTLEKWLARFSQSGRFYDARLMQARALVELNRIPDAIIAYGDVTAGRQDYAVTFEMAKYLPDPEAKLAAYQRIALLAEPGEPLIPDSILLSLPLCLELNKYQLALNACDQFEARFPNHAQLPTIGNFRKEAADALAQ